MTKQLMLLGASGGSRDIIELVEDINAISPAWEIAGILDDDPAKQGQTFCGIPVVGTLADAAQFSGFFVNGIASSKNRRLRRQIAGKLGIDRARFATLIHPTASVSKRADIGCGVVMLHYVVVGPEATIGDHSLFCAFTSIGHDSHLGEGVVTSPSVGISGGVRIGACTFLGSGARLKDGIAVGEGALIGLGAAVIADVPAEATVFGNPARQYR